MPEVACRRRFFEELQLLQSWLPLMDDSEVAETFRRYGREIVGPPPFWACGTDQSRRDQFGLIEHLPQGDLDPDRPLSITAG